MKKIIYLIIFCLILILIIINFTNEYKKEYKVNKFKIKEIYKNKRYYFEIDKKYNFDLYSNRKLSKTLITDIKTFKTDDYICIYPIIENEETYPLCYKDNIYTSYYLIDDQNLEKEFNKLKYKEEKEVEEDFYFNKNLGKEEYIAVWKYNGFYIMNSSEIKEINIFKNDRYSNDLTIIKENKIVFPDYDKTHLFSEFYVLDIKTGKYKKITTKYEIDFDSYIVGINQNSVYYFDNKYKKLYEVNIKREKVFLIGDQEKGYIKYVNNKKEKASLEEYTKDKITFGINQKTNYIYEYNNSFNGKIKDNKKLERILYNQDIKIIKEYQNSFYFLENNKLYYYNPIHSTKFIVKNFEWEFNKENTIFIYNN